MRCPGYQPRRPWNPLKAAGAPCGSQCSRHLRWLKCSAPSLATPGTLRSTGKAPTRSKGVLGADTGESQRRLEASGDDGQADQNEKKGRQWRPESEKKENWLTNFQDQTLDEIYRGGRKREGPKARWSGLRGRRRRDRTRGSTAGPGSWLKILHLQ